MDRARYIVVRFLWNAGDEGIFLTDQQRRYDRRIRHVRPTISSLDIGLQRDLGRCVSRFRNAVVDGVVSITLEYALGEGVDAQVCSSAARAGVKAIAETFATQPEPAGSSWTSPSTPSAQPAPRCPRGDQHLIIVRT
ncbi:hypothetical protein E1212_28035 [Jiangella ureilytica]|uniref:Uncharacterized protein n=1 Tax=Jiangella ureilytica TaxID=2530374 RepID=A0A4R4R9X5_9ACTN|nr:hypothetical protein [Jiangella ureilytica]TDC45904.1 hypothetical protein E1212_28035 [Jiangella ureilytica]